MLKQDPLGGGDVPLGGIVDVDDIKDGVEDEGENYRIVSGKKERCDITVAPPARAQRLTSLSLCFGRSSGVATGLHAVDLE